MRRTPMEVTIAMKQERWGESLIVRWFKRFGWGLEGARLEPAIGRSGARCRCTNPVAVLTPKTEESLEISTPSRCRGLTNAFYPLKQAKRYAAIDSATVAGEKESFIGIDGGVGGYIAGGDIGLVENVV
jgi:hypothetical protein